MSKTDRTDRKPTTTRARSSVSPAKTKTKALTATPGKPKPASKPAVTPVRKKSQKPAGPAPALKAWSVAKPSGPAPDQAKKPKATKQPPAAPELTIRESAFIDGMVRHGNQTRAYLDLDPSITVEAAATGGCRMLRNDKIASELARRRDLAADRANVDATWLLSRLRSIAMADPRELSEWRVGACRYCWGFDHRYQRTQAEYDRDLADHERWGSQMPAAAKKRRRRAGGQQLPEAPVVDRYRDGYEQSEFNAMGGVGFDERKSPHPDCPECFGRGHGRAVMRDTRLLNGDAALLYDGVKQSRDGLELKSLSRMDALEKIAKHIGFYEKDKGAGLAELLESLMGGATKRSALKPVEDPPE